MSNEIIAQIIAAIGVILAAIITGVFLLLSNKKKKVKGIKEIPTISSGGHTIVASEKSTQNVYISSSATPNQYLEQLNPGMKLSELADQIKDRADLILTENQNVLTPLFQSKPNMKKIRKDMIDLFNLQTSRTDFGAWEGYLEYKKQKERNEDLRNLITDLLDLVSRLSYILYSNKREFGDEGIIIRKNPPGSKSDMLMILVDRTEYLPEVRRFAEDYLELLRDLATQIGKLAGKIRSFESS
jgi:hypothetical protein